MMWPKAFPTSALGVGGCSRSLVTSSAWLIGIPEPSLSESGTAQLHLLPHLLTSDQSSAELVLSAVCPIMHSVREEPTPIQR